MFGHGVSSELLFTGGRDQLIKVWNVKSGEVVKELDYHDERITNLFVSKDGKYVGFTKNLLFLLLFSFSLLLPIRVSWFAISVLISSCLLVMLLKITAVVLQ